MAKPDPARLGGMQVFGDPAGFSIATLVGTPGSIDTFLGNAAGTTVGPPVQAYAVAGRLVGRTSAAVQQQIDAIATLVGTTGSFGYPTGLRFPDDFRWCPRYCYFLPAEFRPGVIATAPGNTYAATFQIVLRVMPP